uniref:Uncharacterized protein n=1 Tax=Cannabis sativa TaxID=3483 RepID=A0A803QD61_CANSA
MARQGKVSLDQLKITYILESTLEPLPAPNEKDTLEMVEKKRKRVEDNLLCEGHILNALSNRLYDLYNNTKSAKEIWDALEVK